jgi:translation initiation factor eIF-2B subunit gamma
MAPPLAEPVSCLLQAVAGDAAAADIRAWLSKAVPVRVPVRVVAAPEDATEVATLKAALAAAPASSASPLVVAPADLVTDAPLAAAVLRHFVDCAGATALLAPRGPAAPGGLAHAPGRKAGAAPAGLDYTAVTASGDLVVFSPAPGAGEAARREVRVPARALAASPTLDVRADRAALGAFVFSPASLAAALDRSPNAAWLAGDVVRGMVRAAAGRRPPRCAAATAPRAPSPAPGPPSPGPGPPPSPPPPPPPLSVKAYVAPAGVVAARAAASAAAYLDAARDAAATAARLRPDSPDPVHDTVTLGAKANLAAGCCAGARVALGEKASVKRSSLGAGVRLGRGVKVVGCVLLDGVIVGDGASLQGCAVGARARVGAGAKLRDCFVGPDVEVPADADERDAVLARP